jgi:hypothetical protein
LKTITDYKGKHEPTRRAKCLLCSLRSKQHWSMHESTSCFGWLCDNDLSSRCEQNLSNRSTFTKPLGQMDYQDVYSKRAWTNGQMSSLIFSTSPWQSVIPSCFKQTTIIPVPKEVKVTCLNDHHPLALTPVAMKCFEKAGHGSHQMHPPGHTRPTPNRIPQQIHRWRNLNRTPLPILTWTKGTRMWECCSLTTAQRSTP